MILKGKNAIVTGAAGGIGRSIMKCFAEHGVENIWACDLAESQEFHAYCSELSQAYNVTIIPMYFDLADDVWGGGTG